MRREEAPVNSQSDGTPPRGGESCDGPAPQLSIVVPVYNEQESVGELVQRTLAACRSVGVPFELVLVEDGSRDSTLACLVALSGDTPELQIISLSRNFGHMPSLCAGIAEARGEAIVIMDGDLQDPPELIPALFAEWQAGADVVYGLRVSRSEPLPKRVAISLFYAILDRISETPIPRQVGTFGLIDRHVADVLNSLPERDRFFAGLRAWVGGRQAFVPYDRPDRKSGRSRVGLGGLFRLARTAYVSFSKVPLRFASIFSLCCGLVLFITGVTAILIRLFTNLAIPGWATMTTLLGMTGFVQSVVLAVISEYIAVIFDECKARPLYVVRDTYSDGRSRRTASGRGRRAPEE
jgi:dolichol-phosphate mannosyltransferase